jgi:hypothetical protein
MLDTLASRAPWQKDLNFEIRKWVVSSGKDKFTTRDTLLQAYKYRKSSGAVKAVYKNNVFTVETSGVKSFRILLSPEMVDMGKEVLVIVNGKLYFRRKVAFDKDFMLKEFENTADRTAIWVNRIDVRL